MTEPKESKTTVKADTRKPTGEGKPLIFISHDARDAKLAEAFSKLLSSVSAGVLRSFRASDKKGGEGIEYGTQWFPAIMKKLEEATDVVCLLTRRSVDRPWILYEAGVAFGKFETPVHGLALGIPLADARTGPFAQFQNCEDDEDGLTGLVKTLVQRSPSLDPNEDMVKTAIKTFIDSSKELLENLDDGGIKDEKESPYDAPVAKLFEEIKVMFQRLPSRIGEKITDDMDVPRRLIHRRFHPRMLEEMVHMSKDPSIGILMACSLFRDDIPWLYDLSLEVYRASDNRKSAAEALRRFRHALEFTIHGPFMEEFMMRSKEGHMMMRELERMMMRIEDRGMGPEEDPEDENE